MIFLKKVLNKLFGYVYSIVFLIKIIILSIFHKNKIYLFGTPIHGNLGDQAILLAEREFLKENFKDLTVIEVESRTVKLFQKILPKIVKKNLILVHGGGFLGTLWIQEEEMFRNTLKMFPDNNIIVLPQTVYFENDKLNKGILKESKKIYTAHEKLYICCREKYSYDFMTKEFPTCNVLLIPDMVLYLNGIENKETGQDVLFCIRHDKEKVVYEFNKLKSLLSDYNIDYTDTVISKNIFGFNRKKVLNEKFKQFSKYKLIVTDRLHGMVFSLIAGVPCLVFENKSYKVKGVYDWISHINTIKLYNPESLESDISELLQMQSNCYKNNEIKHKYEELVNLIKNSIV